MRLDLIIANKTSMIFTIGITDGHIVAVIRGTFMFAAIIIIIIFG